MPPYSFFFFSSELKRTADTERTNLVGLYEKSCDVSWLSASDGGVGLSLWYLWMAPGLWEGSEGGSESLVQVRSFWRGVADSFQPLKACCQLGSGSVWESNLKRIELVTCDNIHPAREPEDHINNVRFIRPRCGSNYERPCWERAGIGQQACCCCYCCCFFPSVI